LRISDVWIWDVHKGFVVTYMTSWVNFSRKVWKGIFNNL
jgi:hypothetical protein